MTGLRGAIVADLKTRDHDSPGPPPRTNDLNSTQILSQSPDLPYFGVLNAAVAEYPPAGWTNR